MPTPGQIGPREREILTAIVETYISTGEPVGSRTLSRQGDKKVLAVEVTRSGVVHDRMMRLEEDLNQTDLDTAANYINENFRGWTISDLKAELGRRIEHERSEYDRLMNSLEELYKRGALAAEDPARNILVEGVANLVANEEDREHLRDLLRTLEEKERVAELLAAHMATRQEAVRVVIGLEEAVPEMRNFVLIGAPAHVGGEMRGSLAVIGPTRMDYQHTITAVSYIAQLFDKLLNENS